MSQENVDVVLRMFEAFNQRDRIRLEARWRSDAVIDWSRARGPLKGIYRGVDERRAFYEEFWSTFQSGRTETYDLVEAGDDVVVPNTGHWRGRDGIEVAARSTFVFTVENGLITRLRMFQSEPKPSKPPGYGSSGFIDLAPEAWVKVSRGQPMTASAFTRKQQRSQGPSGHAALALVRARV